VIENNLGVSDTTNVVVLMAAVWNRAGHYIVALWFLSSFFLLLFFLG